jgi:hydroxypyruvate isomerase
MHCRFCFRQNFPYTTYSAPLDNEIAYIQIGDNPGRKEPGTGEVNYQNIFKHLKTKGYQGVLGMEHGNFHPGKDGELKLIEAYRKVDLV